MAKITTLRADWVLPISGEPIPNGEVVIEDDRIAEVRSASGHLADSVTDFGDAILMPGLVNVHTHLDYTVFRGLIEDVEFFPWIRELTFRKSVLDWEDWLSSAIWGAAEAIAGGVTTLGDCTDSGAAFYGAKALGLRGVIYQEVFGIDESSPVSQIVEELQGKVDKLNRDSEGTSLAVGISPHAPYTVRPALFEALAKYAKRDNLPVCIHAAESQAEAELLAGGRGAIAEMFERRGITWQVPGTSTVGYLEKFGLPGDRTLLVHGVQLSANDRHVIREHDFAWAHCPKSNAKLGVGVAPFGLLSGREANEESAGSVRVGIGSDSVASNNTMDIFEELRFSVLMQRGARRQIRVMTAKEAIEMATIGGARALRMEREIGSLEQGKRADLCAIRLNELHSAPAYHPYNALVYAGRASDVIWTMIGGQVRYSAQNNQQLTERFPLMDMAPVAKNLQKAAQKQREWRPSNP